MDGGLTLASPLDLPFGNLILVFSCLDHHIRKHSEVLRELSHLLSGFLCLEAQTVGQRGPGISRLKAIARNSASDTTIFTPKLTSSNLASSTALSSCPPIAASIVVPLSPNKTPPIGRSKRMTPPCRSFPASELPLRIQQDASGRRRKLDDAGAVSRRIDLSACELFRMLQYKCEVQRPLTRESPVRCFAVDRLFRRCVEQKNLGGREPHQARDGFTLACFCYVICHHTDRLTVDDAGVRTKRACLL